MALPKIEDLVAYYTREILPLAVQEDLQSGDITTEATIDPKKEGRAFIEAKDEMILCGLPFVDATFQSPGGKSEKAKSISLIKHLAKDGEAVKRGTIVYEIQGRLTTLLSYERIALNLLQRLTGIASKTHTFSQLLAGSKTKLLDTRKTTAGFRLLEKYAVKTGGGRNHRIGLYDLYMIKDNHIQAGGGIAETVKKVREHRKEHHQGGPALLIEVECKTLQQVGEALDANADVIMLDNMDDLRIREAVKVVGRAAQIEVSGNITQGRLPNLARLDIDFISCGAITHSAPAKDLSMKIFS